MSYEDDRIRSKNKKHQEAYDIYQGLVAFGYNSPYILQYAEFAKSSTSDPFRIDIYNKIMSIARGIKNEVSDTDPTLSKSTANT